MLENYDLTIVTIINELAPSDLIKKILLERLEQVDKSII